MDTDVIRQEDGIDAIKEQCPHFWPAMRVSPISIDKTEVDRNLPLNSYERRVGITRRMQK